MASQIFRTAPPPQRMQFPAQPQPQGGFSIGGLRIGGGDGGDGGQGMMQMLALLQFLSSQESQRSSAKLERDMFELQKGSVGLERHEAQRTRLRDETNNRLEDLNVQYERKQGAFDRSTTKTVESGRKRLDSIRQRAQQLARRLTRTGSTPARRAVENFMAEELPRRVAPIINSTDDPARLWGMRRGLDEILNIFEAMPNVSQDMRESGIVLRTDTFRDFYQQYSDEAHAVRIKDVKAEADRRFNERFKGAQQATQEELRILDRNPGMDTKQAFSVLDQYRELPGDVIPALSTPAPSGGAVAGAAPSAPLVSPGTTQIGQAEGLFPLLKRTFYTESLPFISEHPEIALPAGPIGTKLLRELEPFLFGDPGTQVGLPDADALIRAEQERTGLSNPENTAANPAMAPPVRLIEPQQQGPLDLDDLFRQLEQEQANRTFLESQQFSNDIFGLRPNMLGLPVPSQGP